MRSVSHYYVHVHCAVATVVELYCQFLLHLVHVHVMLMLILMLIIRRIPYGPQTSIPFLWRTITITNSHHHYHTIIIMIRILNLRCLPCISKQQQLRCMYNNTGLTSTPCIQGKYLLILEKRSINMRVKLLFFSSYLDIYIDEIIQL